MMVFPFQMVGMADPLEDLKEEGVDAMERVRTDMVIVQVDLDVVEVRNPQEALTGQVEEDHLIQSQVLARSQEATAPVHVEAEQVILVNLQIQSLATKESHQEKRNLERFLKEGQSLPQNPDGTVTTVIRQGDRAVLVNYVHQAEAMLDKDIEPFNLREWIISKREEKIQKETQNSSEFTPQNK